MEKYQICTRCIMDTSDPVITFDKDGVCNHCRNYDNVTASMPQGVEREKILKGIIEKIKKDGRGREYDCILGVSGGVDSAYTAYLAKQYGLRVLTVHVDAGWNSEIAVSNIKKMCSKLEFDLQTIVVDWETMKELQRAYMFSGLANLDVPQDHAFVAGMDQFARKYHIKYMLHGGNMATEGILPSSWGYNFRDYASIKDVYQKCGRNRISLKKYPHIGILQYIDYNYVRKVENIRLLNLVDYSKKAAIETLSKEFGWEYYGGKHFESRFTKFFQSYYLPQKFGYDKKRAHLSSLIVGGEMSRDEALREMEDNSAYTKEEMLEDLDYILKKLDISYDEWNAIMLAPCKTEDDYKNDKKILAFCRKVKHSLKG